MTKKDYKYLIDKKEYILEHIKNQCNCGNCKYINIYCDQLFSVKKIKYIFTDNPNYRSIILRFYKIHDIKQKLNDQTTN